MLERVFNIGIETGFVEKLGGLQAGKSRVQCFDRNLSDRLQQRIGDIFTDY